MRAWFLFTAVVAVIILNQGCVDRREKQYTEGPDLNLQPELVPAKDTLQIPPPPLPDQSPPLRFEDLSIPAPPVPGEYLEIASRAPDPPPPPVPETGGIDVAARLSQEAMPQLVDEGGNEIFLSWLPLLGGCRYSSVRRKVKPHRSG